jgi:hypothetical protein
MARTQTIAWPDDHELLAMVKDSMSALQIAAALDCSRDSVREKLRSLGCQPNFKGRWIAPNDQPAQQQVEDQPAPTLKSVLEQEFPFIRVNRAGGISLPFVTMHKVGMSNMGSAAR